MSRHRNVRSMNYEEYYDDDDEYYSPSYEDNYCISPGTVAQFTYNRDKTDTHLASYMDEDIPEENEEPDSFHHHDSASNLRKNLSDIDQGRLNSCLEEIRNILGETSTEQVLTECILKHNFDTEKALNELLTQADAPKPQRIPRENRRNRSEGDDEDVNIFSGTKRTLDHPSHHNFFDSTPLNTTIPKLTSNAPIKPVVNTPPLKSIDSLSLALSQMAKGPGTTCTVNKIAQIPDSISLKHPNVKTLSAEEGRGDNQLESQKINLSDLAKHNTMARSGVSLQSLCVASEFPSTSTLSNLADEHQSKDLSKPSGGISLANLASKHEKEKTDSLSSLDSKVSLESLALNHQLNKNKVTKPSTGISLQQLANKNHTLSSLSLPLNDQTNKQGSISLASLAKANQSQQSKEVSKSNECEDIDVISLASLSIKKPSKTKKIDTNIKEKTVERQQSDSHLESRYSPELELFLVNNPANSFVDLSLIHKPYGLARVLTMKYKPDNGLHNQIPKRQRLQFSYKNQIKNSKIKTPSKRHYIKPFDFSVPSPDDIVKEKQKAAFK